MLTKVQRQKDIIKILSEKGVVSPKDLAHMMTVSEMTIRRDIKEMEDRGLIDAFYGGIAISSNNQIEVPRQKSQAVYDIESEQHHKEKIRIAKYACSLIEPRDTIAIDNGSTCAHIPEFFREDTDCMVYTYSLNVSNKVANSVANDVQMFTFGGLYHKKLQVYESREVTQTIKNFRMSKFFMGTVGISIDQGLSCVQSYEKDIRRAFIEQSDEIILLADSSKIGKTWYDHFADISEVDMLITDSGITDEQKEELEKAGIKIVIV